MKLALFITGHWRNAPKTIENYAHFFDGIDTTVYIGTWSTYDLHRKEHTIVDTPVDIEKTAIKLFGNSLGDVWIGDMKKYLNNESPHPKSLPRINFYDFCSVEEMVGYKREQYPWHQRILDQWYTVQQTYQLCKNPDEFDVLFRIRGDMSFIGKPRPPIEKAVDIEGLHVNGFWWTPQENTDKTRLKPFRFSDQFGWGKPNWMKKYFLYYSFFTPLFAPLFKLPEEDFHFGSEHMFAYYMLRYPVFRRLNWDNPDDHDIQVTKWGHESNWNKTIDGVVFEHDYYDLIKE